MSKTHKFRELTETQISNQMNLCRTILRESSWSKFSDEYGRFHAGIKRKRFKFNLRFGTFLNIPSYCIKVRLHDGQRKYLMVRKLTEQGIGCIHQIRAQFIFTGQQSSSPIWWIHKDARTAGNWWRINFTSDRVLPMNLITVIGLQPTWNILKLERDKFDLIWEGDDNASET